ncbi:hypothetical protein AB3X55_06705 [Alphaproteobacteria bacterium LSUCC0719]
MMVAVTAVLMVRERYNNFDTGLQTFTIAASPAGRASGSHRIAEDRKKFGKTLISGKKLNF